MLFTIGIVVLVLGTLADAYSTYRALRWGAREKNTISRKIIEWAEPRWGLKTAVSIAAIWFDGIVVGGYLIVLDLVGAGDSAGVFALVLGGLQLAIARRNMTIARRARARRVGP